MYDSLGRTQYSCVEALKGWILEKKEIITEWDDVNVRHVPEKVQFKLKYCTTITVLTYCFVRKCHDSKMVMTVVHFYV